MFEYQLLLNVLFRLQFKLVTNMTGTLGRKMSFSALVVVGNRNGLAGKSPIRQLC